MEGKLSEAEEAEYWRLQEAVTRIENAIYFAGGADGHATGLMLQFVQNAKQQMARIEVDGQHKAEEKKAEAERRAEVNATLVEREKALNEEEKKEYGGLLKHEYFTKANFGQLEHFYSHSYDKLTEEGKGEMSHRVWEGVRHGAYKFSELPDPVKEKEAQRVQVTLQRAEKLSDDLNAIPDRDRNDFLRARANGERQNSYQILDRPSFTQHVATSSATKGVAEEPARASEAEDQKNAAQSLKTVLASHSGGSKKLDLQDIPEVADPTGNLRPPLADTPGSVDKSRH